MSFEFSSGLEQAYGWAAARILVVPRASKKKTKAGPIMGSTPSAASKGIGRSNVRSSASSLLEKRATLVITTKVIPRTNSACRTALILLEACDVLDVTVHNNGNYKLHE